MKLTFELPAMTPQQAQRVQRAAMEPDARIEVAGQVVEVDGHSRRTTLLCEADGVKIETQRYGRTVVANSEAGGRFSPRCPSPSSSNMRFDRDDGSPPRMPHMGDDEWFDSPFERSAEWGR